MAQVDRITIQGYKSIKSLEDFELKSLNILIGANGVGKSNFISAFRLLNEMYNKRLQFYTQSKSPDNFLYFGRKQTDKIYFKFEFGRNAYAFTLIPSEENKFFIKDEMVSFDGPLYGKKTEIIGKNLEEARIGEAKKYVKYKPMIPYLETINSWKIYHFYDTSDTSKMKGKCASIDNLIFKQDAENLAPYLIKCLKIDSNNITSKS